jgi:serine/threonine protein kinase
MHAKANPSDLAALKLLHRTSPQEQARFQQENHILHELQPHASIAQPYSSVGTHASGLYYLMEYFPLSFANFGVSPHQLTARDRLDAAIRIAEGLSHAHSSGYTHRDLHTGNIMFTATVQPKITDFGRALNFGNLLALTDTGYPGWGAPFFMPPEVYFRVVENDDQNGTRLCDIYSFGLVVYNMFMASSYPFWLQLMHSMYTFWQTNNLAVDNSRTLSTSINPAERTRQLVAWLGGTPGTLVMANLRVTIQSEATLAAGISEVVARAVAFDASNRYSSIDDMLNAMRLL